MNILIYLKQRDNINIHVRVITDNKSFFKTGSLKNIDSP